MNAVVAILDIGKTNKKIALYDRDLKQITSRSIQLDSQPAPDGSGIAYEQIDAMVGWLKNSLSELAADYDILNISITTHGATFALIDAAGKLVKPVMSYTSDPVGDFDSKFYAEYGDAKELQAETFSPPLGLINAAAQLYYIQQAKPDVWAATESILMFPQYLGYLLTGEQSWEPTMVGNHTHLWDFKQDDWSRVATDLDVPAKFPGERRSPWEILGTVTDDWVEACGLDPSCSVTLGVHDSNASLVPYLAKPFDNYILNSTGSWCVLMAPGQQPELTAAELRTMTFFNMDVACRPVKTALLSGGMEYTTFKAFGPEIDNSTTLDAEVLCAASNLFVLPGVVPTAKIFPDCNPGVEQAGSFTPLDELCPGELAGLGQHYFAALNLSLAFQTVEALSFLGAGEGTTVFIEGGFTKNTLYCQALAQLCPKMSFQISNLEQATLFGTALCAWRAVDEVEIEDLAERFEIDAKEIEPSNIKDLEVYFEAFMSRVK